MNKTDEILMLDVILWLIELPKLLVKSQNSKYQLAKKHIDRV